MEPNQFISFEDLSYAAWTRHRPQPVAIVSQTPQYYDQFDEAIEDAISEQRANAAA